jgi:DNA processing protein
VSLTHWVALAVGARLGIKTITRLKDHFGNLEAVFEASPEALRQVRGIGPKLSAAISEVRLERFDAMLREISQQGIQTITYEADGYPANLKTIEDLPPVLFIQGNVTHADGRAVAVVGTRTPSRRGERLAYEIGFELARRGWTIVSGLALGIDAAAHQGALDAGGRTLAVLGCGLLEIYPMENRTLAGRVAENGALMSETHPNYRVNPQGLMARNRITSGLCKAVIVVEAQADSGSVSTARRANKQGRKYYALSGGDAGCDALIEEGATPLSLEKPDWDELSKELERN